MAQFQSTPSVWRETDQHYLHPARGTQFQSTPSVWRETRVVYHDSVAIVISIHSLRVEGDRCGVKSLPKFVGISIHSLRVEGDALPQPPP